MEQEFCYFKSLQELPCSFVLNNKNEDYKRENKLLAGISTGSRDSGSDYAIKAIDDRWSASRAKEASLKDNKRKLDLKAWNCIYVEVEKMSKELYNFIDESKQIEKWAF